MPMMMCGHAANARLGDTPICAICVGIRELDAKARTPAPEPNLEGRVAVCGYCARSRPSAMTLAFFEHRPALATDSYYCGCRGWD